MRLAQPSPNRSLPPHFHFRASASTLSIAINFLQHQNSRCCTQRSGRSKMKTKTHRLLLCACVRCFRRAAYSLLRRERKRRKREFAGIYFHPAFHPPHHSHLHVSLSFVFLPDTNIEIKEFSRSTDLLSAVLFWSLLPLAYGGVWKVWAH